MLVNSWCEKTRQIPLTHTLILLPLFHSSLHSVYLLLPVIFTVLLFQVPETTIWEPISTIATASKASKVYVIPLLWQRHVWVRKWDITSVRKIQTKQKIFVSCSLINASVRRSNVKTWDKGGRLNWGLQGPPVVAQDTDMAVNGFYGFRSWFGPRPSGRFLLWPLTEGPYLQLSLLIILLSLVWEASQSNCGVDTEHDFIDYTSTGNGISPILHSS